MTAPTVDQADTTPGEQAEPQHTGGMIALIPADPAQLAVDGGDPAEQLHLTLAYLGDDVTGWDPEVTAAVHQVAAGLTDPAAEADAPVPEGGESYLGPGQRGPLTLTAFSWSQFNPNGGPDGQEPCLVYQFSGDGDLGLVESLVSDVRYQVKDAIGEVNFPEQHPKFEPHVTAGYGLPPDALSYTGPVTFDRLRVALGDKVTDYPLGGAAMAEPGADGHGGDLTAAVSAKQRNKAKEEGDTYPGTDKFPVKTRDQFGSAVKLAGNSDLPAEKVRKWLMGVAKRKDWADLIPDSWKPDGTLTASAGDATASPVEWFRDPGLDEPTPLTIGDDGRVFGHLALWDSKHIGHPGQNVNPPRSRSDYAYFHTGSRLVADGEATQPIATGHITLDTGHAGIEGDYRAASAHYDDTGTLVADVCAGEDAHGIWVAGATAPGIDDLRLHKLRACGLSGDWRRIGAGLELVAALSVPTPGFPIPRSRVASGEPLALVAAGALPPRVDGAALDYDTLAEKIAERVEQRQALTAALTREQASLVAELDDSPALVASLLAELGDDGEQMVGAVGSDRFTW